jgi:iron complex transport system substrate-binding protein
MRQPLFLEIPYANSLQLYQIGIRLIATITKSLLNPTFFKEIQMKRITMLILFFTLLLAACAPQATATLAPATEAPAATEAPTDVPATPAPVDTSITIIDALGREVKLAAAPKRIVLTGKALFMIADAAYLFPGAADKVTGLGDAGQGAGNFIQLIDPNYAAKATLEKDAGAEQVAALQPDLVILKSYLAESVGASIEALGIPVVYIDFETPEQYSRDLAILGKVFGDDARAAEVAAFFQTKMDEIAQTVKDAPKPRVLILYYNEKDGNVAFNVPPMTWIQTQMVEMAGGKPVWADANPAKGWTQVTLEQVAAWDADQIFVISYFKPANEVVDGLKADRNWAAIRAVKEDKIHAFATDLYSWDQPDPRWILGLTWMAGKIHPDLFPNLDMTAEVNSFYKTLYGLDEAFVKENIVPTFKGVLP